MARDIQVITFEFIRVDLLVIVMVDSQQILPATITELVSQESRGAVTDRASSPAHHVTDVVSNFLQHINGLAVRIGLGVCENLIVDDNVVSWTSGTLERSLGLQVEVPVHRAGYSAVNNTSVEWVGCSVLVLRVGRIEAHVVTFSTDNDGDVGHGSTVYRFGSSLDLWKFLHKDHVVLALANTVTVHENVLGQVATVVLLPQVQPAKHHILEVYNVFLTAHLGSNLAGPLSHTIINGGNNGSNTGEDLRVCTRRVSDIQANDHGALPCTNEACVRRL